MRNNELLAARMSRDEYNRSVADTGVGLSTEMLSHVFELFVQSERSLDRSQGGLGIGLTVVRRLVELHGGTISAWSEGEGQGSEFVVRLPLHTAHTSVTATVDCRPATASAGTLKPPALP